MARCDTYSFGNCTWGACEETPWLPEGLGDAGDWAANAPGHGLIVVQTPVPGSVVSYCRGDGYSFWGHCGMVKATYPDGTFLVREMNYTAFDTYDERVSNMGDVCGFILPAGGIDALPQGPTTPGQDSPVWQVARDWDLLRWYWQVGYVLSITHVIELRSWFDQLR